MAHAEEGFNHVMFASGSVLWPQVVDDHPAGDLAACDPEQRQALAALSLCLSQFLSIKVVVGADLAPRITKRGFLTFTAEGKKKKDHAYDAHLTGKTPDLTAPDKPPVSGSGPYATRLSALPDGLSETHIRDPQKTSIAGQNSHAWR